MPFSRGTIADGFGRVKLFLCDGFAGFSFTRGYLPGRLNPKNTRQRYSDRNNIMAAAR
jgi:hypothetical protein